MFVPLAVAPLFRIGLDGFGPVSGPLADKPPCVDCRIALGCTTHVGMRLASHSNDAPGAARPPVRATCVRCNTEVDLRAEDAGQIRDAGVGSFRRHLIVVDTACRECGTNQRKMVVSVVGRR